MNSPAIELLVVLGVDGMTRLMCVFC
uniref:Uncharacterized protein n=1 Tax=Arundo donax TaxID=35708 RepID=A0A0A9G2C3_ARUDO